MNRRLFLKGVTGLIGVTLLPTTVLSETDIDKFRRLASAGVVENEKFYLEGPLDLFNISNLTIRNCMFIYRRNIVNGLIRLHGNCANLEILNNTFVSNI